MDVQSRLSWTYFKIFFGVSFSKYFPSQIMFSVEDKSDKSSTEPHKENIVQQKWKSIAEKRQQKLFYQ